MNKAIAISFFVIFLFATCKKKDNAKNDAYTPTCVGTKSFANDVFPLIQSKCWRCHNNMDNYAEVQILAASMKDMVISGIMPKDDKLTNAQKDVIVCWVEAGAPNN
jgi:hypothetical protein